MNLSKFRNRHINYTNKEFIRLNYKTDDINLLSNSNLKEVNLYNPNQSQIDNFPSLLKSEIRAINIWGGNYKNCDSFEELESLQYISLHENSKLESIWKIQKNKNLKGIGIVDCNKLNSIEFLSKIPSITEFHLAGSIWKKQNIKSINPISQLENLKFLSLSQLRLEDQNHKPLLKLQQLNELVLSENMFTTVQFAELSVKLKSTECRCFKGFTELKETYTNPEKCKNNKIQIVGIRKPELDPIVDIKRIEKYIAKFNKLKEEIKTGT